MNYDNFIRIVIIYGIVFFIVFGIVYLIALFTLPDKETNIKYFSDEQFINDCRNQSIKNMCMTYNIKFREYDYYNNNFETKCILKKCLI